MTKQNNTEVDQLRVDLEKLQGRKRQLQIETDNLVENLDSLGGLDVQKAVAEAQTLTSEIAGRKAVVNILTSRIAESIEAIVKSESLIQAEKSAAAKDRTDEAREKFHANLWKVYEESKRVALLSNEYHDQAGRRNTGADEAPVHRLTELLQDIRLGTQSSDGTFLRL